MLKSTLVPAILVLGLLGSSLTIAAQSGNQKPSLLVGFYGGVNFTRPLVVESYGIIESIDNADNGNQKDYAGYFSNPGNQFGFVLFYPVAGNFHLGLLPSFSSYSYQYETRNAWNDPAAPDEAIEQTYHHQHKLRYVELPLYARYYIGTAAFKPYVQGIVSYGYLHSAGKNVASELVFNQGGNPVPVSNAELSAAYDNAYIQSKFSLGAGIGISYDLNQLILTLDASMWQGLNNMVNETARYSNPTFVGASYDAQDDLKPNHIIINFSLIFPINKITKRGAVECTYFKSRK